MDDQEIERVETRLREILREQGLGWLVSDVDELVVEGVYEVAAKRKGGGETRETVERPSDARRGVSAVRPYTPSERVRLLLSSVQLAVEDAQRLEAAVVHMLVEPQPAEPGPVLLELFDEREERTVAYVARDGQERAPQSRRSSEIVGSLTALADNLGVGDTDAR